MNEPTEKPAETETTPPPAEPLTWDSIGLGPESLALIEKAGYKNPTAIQSQSIPIAMNGQDLICSSQTGTGKTAGFVLPMIEKFRGREGTFGLILGPTREIVLQIQQTLEQFATPQGIRSISLIGGVDMRHDAKALDTYPHIVCATPGRLGDHLDRGNVWLDYIEMVVLDEADRMLDMGFSDQLNRIMEDVPNDRQTLLFSATIPPTVENLARKIQHNPVRVTIGKPLSAAKSVEQRLIWLNEDDKRSALRRLLRDEPGTFIVFTRSKDGATRVWRSLHSAGVYDATYIHSDRLQAHREQALAEFKSGKYRILIATDVAGRGIHVENVAHVVNYDLPFEPEDYVHRIGRTGRAAASGRATTFATPRDRSIIGRIEKLIGSPIQALNAPFDSESSEGAGGGRPERGGRGGAGRGERGGRGGERGARSDRAGSGGGSTSPRESSSRASTPASGGAPVASANGHRIAPRTTPLATSAPISAADFMARSAGMPEVAGSGPSSLYVPRDEDAADRADADSEVDRDDRGDRDEGDEGEGGADGEGSESGSPGQSARNSTGGPGAAPELGPDGLPKRKRRRRGGRGRKKGPAAGGPGSPPPPSSAGP